MDKKWNLQDIQPAAPRKRRRPIENREQVVEQHVTQEISDDNDGTVRIGIENGTKKKKKGLVVALVVFFVILGAGFVASIMMAGADITVFPRNRTPNVNAEFEAYRTPKAGELSYEIMSLEANGERQVSATGSEEVEELATGEIIIYNELAEAERLIKNTRFETPDGLVYRIQESVVVPAAGTSGGNTVPGSIRAEVFADAVGEEYNIPKTKMTIPGYKEGGYMELYNGMYAENPEPITGGFKGEKFIIDELELEAETQRLRMELRNALLDKIDSERPAGFVVFDDAVAMTYETLPAVEYGENLATIKEQALLQIPIFKEADFASFIAAATIPGYEGEAVRIDNLSDLTFSFTEATTSATNIANLDSVSFALSGKPLIVWTYDEGRLKTDIVGKSKTALTAVLGGYPAIERAEAVVRPFWKTTFPTKLEDIVVTEVVETE